MALGTFDGLHDGHRTVLGFANGHSLTVLTFCLPPKAYINGDTSLIMLPSDKEEALKKIGADNTVFLDFNKIKNISAEVFSDYIKKEYSPDLIVCGFNFRFGKDALGDVFFLENFCKKNRIDFKSVPAVIENGIPISSTYLRNLIEKGDVLNANRHIFGGFGFSAEVLNGDKRGRTLGFPTINQKYPDMLVKPRYGVYSSSVYIDGKEYQSVTNLGIRPTFKTNDVLSETHIFDFCGDLYGQNVRLNLKKFIREEKRFLGTEQLKNAIKKDISEIKGENL